MRDLERLAPACSSPKIPLDPSSGKVETAPVSAFEKRRQGSLGMQYGYYQEL